MNSKIFLWIGLAGIAGFLIFKFSGISKMDLSELERPSHLSDYDEIIANGTIEEEEPENETLDALLKKEEEDAKQSVKDIYNSQAAKQKYSTPNNNLDYVRTLVDMHGVATDKLKPKEVKDLAFDAQLQSYIDGYLIKTTVMFVNTHKGKVKGWKAVRIGNNYYDFKYY